ncbi:hypothetical protein QBC40DRAFT_327764 [Triangularia verruculosa]|uniref:Uncharacterized protein n=1 Tax=Triangularia verruculosa TaxID=2587418 RepID=A0AAN6XGR5_9PEZI|nr:hypothetical protein QBC40DRAFT_327764 [Triangularia verruculosa]
MCDCVPAFASGWSWHGDINGSASLTPPDFLIFVSPRKPARKMTLIDDIQEKTYPKPSASHFEPRPKLKTSAVTLRSSVFHNPFSFKSMGSSPGKLPAFLMITALFCVVTLGAASPFIAPEEHRPSETPHISPEQHRPAEVPHIAPDHPAYHPEISQPHHEPEEGQHRPERPTYCPSFPRPRHEFREEEHRPEERYQSGEQDRPEGYHPEGYHPEGLHHPENHPEVHIRSPLPQSPAPLPAGAYAPSTPCPPSIEGQWNCMLTSWQRCGSGIWSAVMPTAKGTQCAPGGISAQLKTVNAPDYPPAAEPEQPQPQPQPQGNTDGWGQGLPPRYSASGRLGVSMRLAGAAVAVAVMVGGLA